MRSTLLLLPLVISCASDRGPTEAQSPARYRVSLSIPETSLEIPFILEVEASGRAFVRNGVERVEVPEFEIDADGSTWRLRFDRDSILVLDRRDDERSSDGPIQTREVTTHVGEWTLLRGTRGTTVMRARAQQVREDSRNISPIERFPSIQTLGAPDSSLRARYAVDFSSSEDDAVATFEVDADGEVAGNFRTTLGDYRFLQGEVVGDFLRLSCFDGHHAFLFHAAIGEDGRLTGDFWSRDTWHETWIGTPDPDADLPDTFARTGWVPTADPEAILCTGLDGVPTDLGKILDGDRPTVLIVFGSWCPNCHDATTLWANLHRRYQDDGLRVLGLAFELTADTDKELAKLREFQDRQGIDFDLYLCGLADKDAASEALPVLDRVRAYPTTIFLTEDGEALAVHTGFDGPATGEAHTRLRQRFTALIGELLGR